MSIGQFTGFGFQNPKEVVANTVIIEGDDGGLYVYNPAQAPGDLIAAITQQPTDSEGNVTIEGIAAYNNAAGYAVQLASSGIAWYAGSEATGWVPQAELIQQGNGTTTGSYLTLSSTLTGRSIGAAWVWPSGDLTGATDVANIQGALAISHNVRLLPGTFYLNAPLLPPDGSILEGSGGNILSLNDYNTTLSPVAGWAQGAAPAAGIIVLEAGTEEQQIKNLNIEQINMVAIADGINSQGATPWALENICINNATANGVNQAVSSNACRGKRVVVHRAAESGFILNGSDQDWDETCIAQGCNVGLSGAPGWSIATCSNSRIRGRSENTNGTGNGFTYTADNSAGGGIDLDLCTNYNGGHGVEITSVGNVGGGPVKLSGKFTGDGWNPYPSGNGGGGYAGVYVTNLNMSLDMTDVEVIPTPEGTSTGPEYGMHVTTCNANGIITMSGCTLWGFTQAVNTDNSTTILADSSCLGVTGDNSAPVYESLTFWHFVGNAGQPAFGTGWSNYGHGCANLAFRREGDKVLVNGVVTPGAGVQPILFQLPSPFTGLTATQGFVGIDGTSGITCLWQADASVSPAEILFLSPAAGGGPVAGDPYYIDGEYSLNITA